MKLSSLIFSLFLAGQSAAFAAPAISAAQCSLSIPSQDIILNFNALLGRTQKVALKLNSYLGTTIMLEGFFFAEDFKHFIPGTPNLVIEYGAGEYAIKATGIYSGTTADPQAKTAQTSLKMTTDDGEMDGKLFCSKVQLSYLLVPKDGRQASTLDAETKQKISSEIHSGRDVSFCLMGSGNILLREILHSNLVKETANLRVTESGAVAWSETYTTCDAYRSEPRSDSEICTKYSSHSRENMISVCQ